MYSKQIKHVVETTKIVQVVHIPKAVHGSSSQVSVQILGVQSAAIFATDETLTFVVS